jgi:membrane protein DedA with SNARE-associated domain
MQHEIEVIVRFTQDHAEWAVPIVFMLAFAESLVLISLLVPATIMLMGVGGLIGLSQLSFMPLWLAATLGAVLGDWLSFWLGQHYHEPISRMRPFAKRPDLLARGHRFFVKWGVTGVFIGRFFGPLRASVPLAAGACGMSATAFQWANLTSAALWAASLLGPGALGLPTIINYLPK